MSIERIEWKNTDYGSHPRDLEVSFTSRTYYTDGSHSDLRFRISHEGNGYNIHTCPVAERQPRQEPTDLYSRVMMNVEHWHGALALTTHNMGDLADVLAEYNRRLAPLFRLRQGSAAEQLGRTLGEGE